MPSRMLPLLRMLPLRILGKVLDVFSLHLLLSLVVYRTRVTIYPELDVILCKPQEDFLGYVCNEVTTSSEFACVGIWITVTYITLSLSWRIIITGLGRSIFNNFHKILSLFSIMSYEIWMFAYIYNTYYVEGFDPIFKVIILFPLLALLVHSSFQTFLPYNVHVAPSDEESMKNLVYYTFSSSAFNFIMIVHVFCMGLTAWYTGLSKEENLTYVTLVVILGFAEIVNRAYVIYKHSCLLLAQYRPYETLHRRVFKRDNQRVYQTAVLESINANPDEEVVTGKTLDTVIQFSKEHAWPVAVNVTVAVIGVCVAGNIV